jgi:hypothetical protein
VYDGGMMVVIDLTKLCIVFFLFSIHLFVSALVRMFVCLFIVVVCVFVCLYVCVCVCYSL